MNAIGVTAMGLLASGWLGAAISFLVFRPDKIVREDGVSVWKHPKLRRAFLTFVGFCALGTFSALIGFLWGGWPQK